MANIARKTSFASKPSVSHTTLIISNKSQVPERWCAAAIKKAKMEYHYIATLTSDCIEEDKRRVDLIHHLCGSCDSALPLTSGLSDQKDYHSSPLEEFGVPLLRQASYQPFPTEVEKRLKGS